MDNSVDSEAKSTSEIPKEVGAAPVVKKPVPKPRIVPKAKPAIKKEPVKVKSSIDNIVTANNEKTVIPAKKRVAKKVSQPKKPLSEEICNPEVLFIVDESPTEIVFDAIEVLDQDLAISEGKKKKTKKSELKKAVKRSTLCKLVKNDYLKKHFTEYIDLVKNPVWICKKCGRAANDPRFLCKPRFLIQQETIDTIIL